MAEVLAPKTPGPRIKVLMLTDSYPPQFVGGGGRHVQSLSRELSKKGCEAVICTIGHPDLPKYEEEDGLKIYRLEGLFQKIPLLFKDPAKRYHPPTQDWSIAKQLRQIFQEEKPDVIHAHGWILYSILPWKTDLKIPLLVTLHDYGFLCPRKSLLNNKSALCDQPFSRNCIVCGKEIYGLVKSSAVYYGVKINKKKLKLVDKFIAVSSFVKQVYVKHLRLDDKDIVMIPNFYATDIDREREKSTELPGDFILFVGTLGPYKGANVLIEAYQKLNTKTKLVLIGGTHLDYHYESTEDILVIGSAPHDVVMQAVSRCRFAVFPSVWPDPCPTVAFEAMSQGKAVIASEIGGLTDIVVNGQTGILVPPSDSDKLAEAISYLLQNPEMASEMGHVGYERFMGNYTPDAVAAMVIDVYKSLL